MNFKIHRGTKEIGGSCVEVWTKKTRILIDFGMPLVDKDGSEFNINKYKKGPIHELIREGILPDVKGIYQGAGNTIDGVIISHAHQDHYGLTNYINRNVTFYLGEATHKLIQLNNLFTPQNIQIDNTFYFTKSKTFNIGDFSITPYWADHSAFDSYSFLVEANGKSILYSGDFRSHGRKSKVFEWFSHNAPINVDYLLLEGTTIGRSVTTFKSEADIEEELLNIFKQKEKINLIYTSGQNIDRLVSTYRACIRAQKIMVVDVYVASILKAMSKYASIPYPSKDHKNLRVINTYFTNRRLDKEGNQKIIYQFKKFKITKDEINKHSEKIVMIVRPSIQKDLEHLTNIDGGNFIYSMWEGYLKKNNTKKFVDYLKSRKFNTHQIHTSGHADTNTLNRMVEAINPKRIVPIHTFNGVEYKKIFKPQVVELNDGEEVII